eukprot:1372615-Pyramimonas_sp.AAC.1
MAIQAGGISAFRMTHNLLSRSFACVMLLLPPPSHTALARSMCTGCMLAGKCSGWALMKADRRS